MQWLCDHPWLLILLAYGVVNLLAFVMSGWDKRAAVRRNCRVPERNLHLIAIAGGFVGAWCGRRVFRHKTRKRMFAAVPLVAAVVHAAFWIWMIW